METLIDIRSEILDLSHLILEKINKIYEDNDKHPIFKKIAEHYKERLKEIEKICSISKYNLYLIGSAGIGKSTLLSTLLNLIDYDKLVREEKLSDCLYLKIGTGRITVCETNILFRTDNTKFEIVPKSAEEFKGDLRNFVNYLFKKPTNLSMEEIKAIKNMLHIPRKENTEEKMLSYLGFTDNEDIDVLVNDLFDKIKYESRIKTEIIYQPNVDESFPTWFKRLAIGINDGRLDECPFPAKINIYFSEKDFDFELPDFINTIADTRGLSGDDGDRNDIQTYLAGTENISIFFDDIANFGGDIKIWNILKPMMLKENRNIGYHVFLCGIERGKGLGAISDTDSREEGMIEKKNAATSAISAHKIAFKAENIFFHNSANGIRASKEDDGEIFEVADNVKELIATARKNFFAYLENRLCSMYKDYKKEVSDCLELFNRLSDNIITDDIAAHFSSAYDSVKFLQGNLVYKQGEILNKLYSRLIKLHPGSLRGAVNNNGCGNTDIYASFRACGEDIFQAECSDLKENLVGRIDAIFTGDDDITKICHDCIAAEIDRLYTAYYGKCQNQYYNIPKDKLYHDSSAWSDARSYWGNSHGNYREKVVESIIEETKKRQLDVMLQNLHLQDAFFNEVSKYLELNK
ncbi:hypothetical protein [Thomasclavelia cocleata]|uniref:hypothetical protein n=1 Tax=Thomasclavelia cocleata TaxID=69824 RepID=UPI00272EA7F0|nr:hypothetical protein [Thomasclavelia cocleata]